MGNMIVKKCKLNIGHQQLPYDDQQKKIENDEIDIGHIWSTMCVCLYVASAQFMILLLVDSS